MSYTIKTLFVDELVIEKSRFIALLCPLDEEYDFSYYMKEIKKDYKDARHYTYALRYLNNEKASDDGEPQNTAGMPLLNLLKQHDLMNILLVVVRYFGGKKLGAGRLLRTYVDAGNKVILKSIKYEEIPGYQLVITVPISQYDRVKYTLQKEDINIINTNFDNTDVEITLGVAHEDVNQLENLYNVKSKNAMMLLKEVSDGK